MSSCSDIFPTIDFLLPAFQASQPTFPPMPTVPTPLSATFPTLNIPSVEIAYATTGAQMALSVSIVAVLIEQLTKFVPAVPIPPIPGLPGFGLQDLLAFNPSPLLAAVQVPGFNSSSIPGVPTLWPSMNAPDWSSFEALQHIFADYLILLTDTVLALVKTFLDLLDDKGLSFPTLTFPPSIPGVALPTPLLPDMNVPEFTQTYTLLANKINTSGFLVKSLAEFVQSLPLISLPIPSMTDVLGSVC